MPLLARSVGVVKQLQAKLEARALKREIAPEIAKRVAALVQNEIGKEFRNSVNPYGEPWKPVFRNRKRDRNARARREARGLAVKADKPLIDTGRLRASVTVTVKGGQVRAALPVEYASYHQEGTSRIARRQILPDGGRLPDKWASLIAREAKRVLRDRLEPKGG